MFFAFLILITSSVEIPPGAQLYGLTVFSGTKIDTVNMEFISRIPNGGMSGDLLVARCWGDYIEHIGVLQGMSGSPVFFQEQLIGAMSIAWSDNREPIVGITPLEDMERDVRFGLKSFTSDINSPSLSPQWREFQVGISVSGLASPSVNYLSDNLQSSYQILEGGTGLGESYPLQPGGVLCIGLVTGDANVAAFGTITKVNQDTVWGFGHAFTSEGSCSYPLCGGKVNLVMPLRTIGFKVASPGEILGTITSDVPTGVAGVIGPIPQMINLKVQVNNDVSFREYNYQICRSKLFTPVMLASMALNSLIKSGLYSYQSFFQVRTEFYRDGQLEISLNNAYNSLTTYQSEWLSTLQIVTTVLLENEFQTSFPDSVKLVFDVYPEIRQLNIENAFLSTNTARGGEEVEVRVLFSDYQSSGDLVDKYSITIPANITSDTLGLLISDAANLSAFNEIRNNHWGDFRDYRQLVNLINNLPSNNSLYLILYQKQVGMDFGGEEISAFPLSFLGTIKYSGFNTSPVFTNYRILDYQKIDYQQVIRGVIVKRISVEG